MGKMISKQHYEYLKSLPQNQLTPEYASQINEYEKDIYGYPSESEISWANKIVNTKDARLIADFRASGEMKRAMDVLDRANAARNTMQREGVSPWEYHVKRVPEDVAKGYGFKFNWKDAYEQKNGTKLKPTEADAEKLDKFIASKMYDVGDDVSLQKIAVDLGIYVPKRDGMWSEFIQSSDGDRFKEYIKDVEKYQKEKALDEIWSSEPMVDFMLPVSKEYAKNNYENIDTPKGTVSQIGTALSDMPGAFGADVAANLAMTGRLPFVKNPTIRAIYGNTAAPIITEGSNVIANDKPVDLAAINALEGTLINANAPMFLRRGGNWLENFARRGGTTGEALQKTLNEAASKAREVSMRKKAHHIWREGDVIKKIVKDKETVIQPTAKDLKNIIPDSDIQLAERGRMAKMFGLTKGEKKAGNVNKYFAKKGGEEKRVELAKKIASGQIPTSDEIRRSGFNSSESFMNWLSDNVPEAVSDYLTNLAGRPKIGQRGMGSLINVYAPDFKLFKDKNDREKGTDKWYRYYGLE